MQSAYSHNGELISADRAGRGWYSCRTCGRAVVLKCGAINRPHFAHKANVASPECDDFHPGRGLTISSVSSTHHELHHEATSLSWASLYLSHSNSRFELSVLLPVHRPARVWTGRIVYSDQRGRQSFTCPSFQKRTSIGVLPQRDSYHFLRDGDVAEPVWASLIGDVQGLADRNVFHRSEFGGRRLESNEPMELGKRYWLVVPLAALIAENVAPLLSVVGELDAWTIYEVSLPDTLHWSNLSNVDREYFEDWFDHPIKTPNARVWIASPFPLYTESDVWVLPPTEKVALVIGETDERPSLEELTTGNQTFPAKGSVDGQWIAVGLHGGFYTVRLGSRVCIALQVLERDPENYNPQPIELVVGASKIPLFASEMPLKLLRAEENLKTLTITTSDALPRGFVRVNGREWLGNNLAELFTDSAQDFEIDGGAFGIVRLSKRTPNPKRRNRDPSVFQTAAWLLSLAEPRNSIGGIRFPAVMGKLPLPLIPLLFRTWPRKLAPHVVNLWRKIHREQLM